jgi:hypothetical protein
MKKNIEITGSGLKCDNLSCDWVDETILLSEYEKWLNAPCPKCGENVLTEEDFKNSQDLLKVVSLINSFSPEDLAEISRGIVVMREGWDVKLSESFKELPVFADTEGIKILDTANETDKLSMKVDTHKTITVKSITKI